MSFFDELGDSIVSTAKDVGKFAQNTTEIGKLEIDKKKKESELSKMYEELGKKYYAENPENESDDFQEIKATILRIQELNDEITKKKGGKACVKCGALVKPGAQFCSSCGEKVNDIFED